MDGRGDGKHGGPPGRDMLGPLVGQARGKAYAGPGAHKEKLRKRDYARPAAGARRARPYAELRAASAFSFLNGASLPEDLADTAAALDLPAMALIDTNGLSGAPRFWKAAKQAGIKALVGAEVVLGRGPKSTKDFSLKVKRGRSDAREAADAPRSGASRTHSFEEILPGPLGLVPPPLPPGVSLPRLTLLAENQRGYKNLCSLLTAAAAGKPKGQAAASWEDVAAHAEGLHVLTGGEESAVTRALVSGGLEAAGRELDRLAALFPGRVHVELQRHLLRGEEHANRALLDLARARRLPVLATNGVRYARRRDKDLFDALTCIRHHTHLDAAGTKLHAGRERHLKSAADMQALFADLPGVLEESAALASRLSFTLADLGYRFPEYPLPPGETPSSYLRRITWEGARGRFRPLTTKAQAQLTKELNLIEKLDLAGYFLIVWDVVDFCRKENILVQGRGSAANSAVCYALSITAVDPVQDGAPLRALPLGGARRVARHRPRPPLRRPAREGHPARLQDVRRARGRDDGERHHVPRPLGGARDGEGRRLRAGAGRHARQAPRALELRRVPRRRARPLGRDGRRGLRPGRGAREALRVALHARPEPAAAPRPALGRNGRRRWGGCPRSCRSSPRPWRGASSSSGTRTTARTSGS